jgi:hypothetical protein
VVIEDFPYFGVYFRGSTNLVLFESIHWDASGMKHNLATYILFCFLFFIFLVVQ